MLLTSSFTLFVLQVIPYVWYMAFATFPAGIVGKLRILYLQFIFHAYMGDYSEGDRGDETIYNKMV